MRFFFMETWQIQHPRKLSTTCAIYDLFTYHSSSGTKTHTIDLPAPGCFGNGLREFVVRDLDTRLLALLLSKYGIEELVHAYLILPMMVRYL